MRDEIISGLKNALEHGSTIEDAVESFINAGYNPIEVKEAVRTIKDGATSIIEKNSNENFGAQRKMPQVLPPNNEANLQPRTALPITTMPSTNPQMIFNNTPRKRGRGKIIIIIFLIVLLLLLIGAIVAVLFYGEEIALWFG